MVAMKTPLFQLGRVISTVGALEALDKAGQQPWELHPPPPGRLGRLGR